MFDSPVLEVVIGVVLVYVLISMLCSAMLELISARLRLRARDLEEGLRTILASPPPVPTAVDRAGFVRSLGELLWLVTVAPVKTVGLLIRGGPYGEGRPTNDLAGAFFDHPLIRNLKHQGKLPSYVAARTFSAALLDLIDSRDPVETIRTLATKVAGQEAQQYLQALLTPNRLEDVRQYIRSLPSGDLKSQLLRAAILPSLDEIEQYTQQLDEGDVKRYLEALLTPASVQEVRATVDRLPDGKIKETALSLIGGWADVLANVEALTRGTAAHLEAGRKEIERWFDDAMERVSGWYKRRAQVILLMVAVPVVIALNADTIGVATSLWQDDLLRAAFVGQAERLVQGTPPPANVTLITPATATTESVATPGLVTPVATPSPTLTPSPTPPTGATPAAGARSGTTTPTPTATPAGPPGETAVQIRDRLEGLKILGWRPESDKYSDPREHPRLRVRIENGLFPIRIGRADPEHNDRFSLDALGWLEKIVGLTVTWLAVSQGAPFWFDLLKRIVNVRSTGRSPAPSGGTGSAIEPPS